MVTARPNFVEKTFTGGSKTAKVVNVFSLKSFPLYDICAAAHVYSMHACSNIEIHCVNVFFLCSSSLCVAVSHQGTASVSDCADRAV